MWTRRELKERAKDILRGNYWKAFLISLVLAVATGGGGGGGGRGASDRGYNNFTYDFDPSFFYILIAAIIGAGIIILIAIALRIFVFYSLEVGGRRYFVQSAQRFDNRRCFRFAFDSQHYLGIVGTMFLKGIFNFLWFLLFLFPGIVKAYAYSMVPYILADNPNIGALRAIELSKRMTRGHKFDMFVLDLSFLGWYLLGAILFGVGILFVYPYDNATKAELYLVLRQNAIQGGMCSLDELNLYDPNQGEYNI